MHCVWNAKISSRFCVLKSDCIDECVGVRD